MKWRFHGNRTRSRRVATCPTGDATNAITSGRLLIRVAPPPLPPYRTRHGSATSGESQTSAPRRLFGSQESGGEGCANPAGTTEDQSQAEEAGSGHAGNIEARQHSGSGRRRSDFTKTPSNAECARTTLSLTVTASSLPGRNYGACMPAELPWRATRSRKNCETTRIGRAFGSRWFSTARDLRSA
jgi:hypothetical protein